MKNLPNILTVLRMLLVPFFIYYFVEESYLIAMIIFVVASMTDWFDGYLARKWNVITTFGKIMDPLADKLLVLSALGLVSIGENSVSSLWVFYIVLFREISITILRELYKKHKIIVAANWWGKVKTVMQMVGLTVVLVIFAFNYDVSMLTSQIIYYYFWGIALVTILSGLTYFKEIKELLK